MEEFDIVRLGPDGSEATLPRFNIAPTDLIPAVVERPEGDEVVRSLVGLRWGLVPSWSTDARGGARMINARSETVATKPAFRKAFSARRCLLPAIGYYEWQARQLGGKTVKQPWFIRPASGETMVMGGIYEFWKSPEGEWLTTASIITSQATDAMGWVHDRMPVFVRREHWADWLDPQLTDPAAAQSLWHVPNAADLDVYPVSHAVNRVGTNEPQLIDAVSGVERPE